MSGDASGPEWPEDRTSVSGPAVRDTQELTTVIPPRFRVLGELGRGGMGAVFRARDEILGRDVAIKCIVPGLLTDPTMRARFLREARAAASMRHPGIVQLFDVDPEARFLVMEFVDGETLAARLKQRLLTVDEARDVGVQVLDALAAAHAVGVVHRDIKPGNLILAADGRVRLVDFGIALLEGESELTRVNQRLGTPAYTAPEQLRGQRVDGRADQFALAATLFKALVGHSPFSRREGTPRTPRDVLLDLTRDASLAEAIARSLSESPEARFPDAASFASALTRTAGAQFSDATSEDASQKTVEQQTVSSASMTAPRPSAPTPVPASTPVPAPTPDPAPPKGRVSVWRWSVAALVVSTSAAAVYWSESQDTPAANGVDAPASPAAARTAAPTPLEALRRAVEQGDTQQANALLAPMLVSGPLDSEAAFLHVIVTWWEGKPSDELARRVADARIGATPRQAALLDAIMLTHRDAYEEAIRAFRAIVAEAPTEPFAQYGLFESLYHGGRRIEALRTYRALARDHEDFGLGLLHLGDQYVSRRDDDGMRFLLERLERVAPLVDRHFWTARVLVARREYSQAIAYLNTQIETYGPEAPHTLVDLVYGASVLNGNFDQVHTRLLGSQANGEDRAEALLGLALARGDVELAAKARHTLTTRTVQGERARFEKAWTLAAMSLWPKSTEVTPALDALTDALEAVPAVGVRGHVVRMMLAHSADKPEVAQSLLASPLPDVRSVASAFTAEAAGDLDAALARWSEAIDACTSGRIIPLERYHRARVLLAAGRFAEVPAECEAVIQPPLFDWTWGGLVGPCMLLTARAHAALGQHDAAAAMVTRLRDMRGAAAANDALLSEAAGLVQAKAAGE